MATLKPADMDAEQIEAALIRLAAERAGAATARRAVIGRVMDAVLDAKLELRAVTQAEQAEP